MYMNNNPFGSLPQFAQQMGGQQMMPLHMAGPGGFNGPMTPPTMQGMPGQQMRGMEQPSGQFPPMGQQQGGGMFGQHSPGQNYAMGMLQNFMQHRQGGSGLGPLMGAALGWGANHFGAFR